MGFYRGGRLAPQDVSLELTVVDEEVVAVIQLPATKRQPPLHIANVPLAHAIRLAAGAAAVVKADVAVMDAQGLWPC